MTYAFLLAAVLVAAWLLGDIAMQLDLDAPTPEPAPRVCGLEAEWDAFRAEVNAEYQRAVCPPMHPGVVVIGRPPVQRQLVGAAA